MSRPRLTRIVAAMPAWRSRASKASARWVLGASVLLALVPLVAGPFLTLSVKAFDRIDVGTQVVVYWS